MTTTPDRASHQLPRSSWADTPLLDRIKGALGDPDAPWYGSDLVPWVADLVLLHERRERAIRDAVARLRSTDLTEGCNGTPPCMGLDADAVARVAADLEHVVK